MQIKKVFYVLTISLLLIISMTTNKQINAIPNDDLIVYKFLDDSYKNTKLHENTEETYNPEDRKWQGIPQIAVSNGGRIWASWYSGGDKEPSTDNYIVLSYSDDGVNFVDPFIIIDHANYERRVFDPVLFLDTNKNELWIFFCFNGYGKTYIKITNPDASPEEITWTTAVNTGFGNFIHPTFITDSGEWLIPTQISTSEISIMTSVDSGRAWIQKSIVKTSPTNKTSHECQLVQLSNSEIWLLARIDSGYNGGIERWISLDGGNTFNFHSDNMESPLCGPGSKFCIKRLSSGNLLLVNNNSVTYRSEIVAFYSTDNGNTWEKGITLDYRNDVSYPEIAVDSNDNIYVIWDKGRYAEHEIRYSRFTEADLISGVMIDENDKNSIVVSRTNSSYRDISSTDPAIERVKYYDLGTEKATIINDLPTSFKLICEDNKEIDVTGKWKPVEYNKDVLGTYRFYFISDSLLPLNYSDGKDLLSCYVILKEKEPDEETPVEPDNKTGEEKKGCKSSLSASLTTLSLSLLGLGIAIKRKKEQ